MIPKLVAHRGYMRKYPENSLPGLEMALQAGACMVEFDVQMAADHEFVLLHDDDLQRTAGLADSVFSLSATELVLASVHQPEKFGDQFLKTPIPTLMQAMELVAGYPLVTAFVEIKDESIDKWGLEFVMDRLLTALEPYLSQSVIIAYSYSALQYIKQKKACPTGWVLRLYDEDHYKKAIQLAPEYLICNQTKIPDDSEPWQGVWSWMLYDIVDPEQALQWAGRGIELIETEDIGGMLEHDELQKESCRRDV
jgi:glycerophosphoryl diester phosphodiesterase